MDHRLLTAGTPLHHLPAPVLHPDFHPRELDSPMNDIITGIIATAGREPYRTAIIDGRGRELTYGELARRVDAVRAALAAPDGAGAGDRAGHGHDSALRPGTACCSRYGPAWTRS
nr:hypothetical protein GCM10020093_074590 [Planobispora longispora]